MQLSHRTGPLPMAETGGCMHLSYVSADRGGSGSAAGANRALHVPAHPLVGTAHVERRLVRSVERSHGHHVAGTPAGDVAARPGVDAPAPEEDGLRVAGRLAV